MCIYCGSMNYRKIYENHFTKIPTDIDGRKYEVHHIDSDHTNNSPDNLVAVTIQEHYNMHYEKGDWCACLLIAGRMKISPAQKSELASLAIKQRIEAGVFHFTSANAKKWQQTLIDNGLHHFLTENHRANSRAKQLEKVKNGTHHMLKEDNHSRQHVIDGTHHFLGAKINNDMLAAGRHASQKILTCPHCNESMGASNYVKHHGDNCHLVKEKIPLSANPNYVNSRALNWSITNTETGITEIICGLKTWANKNGFNANTVTWSVRKHRTYKQFRITRA